MKIKKNKSNKYAPITHAIDFILKLKEIFVILAAILLWVLGVWFTTKLAPIREDLQGVVSTAHANSDRITECETTNKSIDEKLDKLIISMSEITGILKGKEIIN